MKKSKTIAKKKTAKSVSSTIDELCRRLVGQALQPDAFFDHINNEFGDELGEACAVLNPRYADLLKNKAAAAFVTPTLTRSWTPSRSG